MDDQDSKHRGQKTPGYRGRKSSSRAIASLGFFLFSTTGSTATEAALFGGAMMFPLGYAIKTATNSQNLVVDGVRRSAEGGVGRRANAALGILDAVGDATCRLDHSKKRKACNAMNQAQGFADGTMGAFSGGGGFGLSRVIPGFGELQNGLGDLRAIGRNLSVLTGTEAAQSPSGRDWTIQDARLPGMGSEEVGRGPRTSGWIKVIQEARARKAAQVALQASGGG